MWPLKERVVVVTGASSGIGRAVALAAAREGAQVCVAARRERRLDEVAAGIQRLGAVAHVFPADLSDPTAATRLVEEAVARLGRIDVLVNNAGYGLYSRIEDAEPGDFERIFAVNVLSPLAAMRAAIPIMRRQGEGHIVNVASIAAARGVGGFGAYCATKAALVRLTEAARVELHGSGVRASVVNPGRVATEFSTAAEVRGGARPYRLTSPMAADRVAAAILDCVRTGAADVAIPRVGRLVFGLAGFFPGAADLVVRLAMRRARSLPSPGSPS